jgi:autotransporter-associated beta strand protein
MRPYLTDVLHRIAAIAPGDTTALGTSGGGATFDTAGYAVTLSGSGSLTKVDSGELSLATTNTCAGDTFIGGGTLALGSPLALQDILRGTFLLDWSTAVPAREFRSKGNDHHRMIIALDKPGSSRPGRDAQARQAAPMRYRLRPLAEPDLRGLDRDFRSPLPLLRTRVQKHLGLSPRPHPGV